MFLLLPVAYGAIKGLWKGLILEVASLAALVIITVFGVKLVSMASPTINEWLGDSAGFLPFLPYLLVFIAIGFAVRFIGLLLKKTVNLTPLGLLDKVGGAFFGALKWGFAVCLLVYFANNAGLDTAFATVKESSVYPFYLEAAPSAWAFVQWVIPVGKDALGALQ